MNELELPNDLPQIELRISHHKQIAGQSIWEIGRLLNHVKENNLAHGQFIEWVEHQGLNRTEAHRMMKVATELPNVATLQHLGTTALHLIATLPDEVKAEQLERIEQGDNPTVRELQDIKRQLKLSQADNERLKNQNENLAEQVLDAMANKTEPQVVEKEVVREVVPDDYQATKELMKASKRNEEFYRNQNNELREEMKELERIIKDKDKQLLTQEELRQITFEVDKKKDLVVFINASETFLDEVGNLMYTDLFQEVLNDRKSTHAILETVSSIEKWVTDLKNQLPKNEIIEEQ